MFADRLTFVPFFSLIHIKYCKFNLNCSFIHFENQKNLVISFNLEKFLSCQLKYIIVCLNSLIGAPNLTQTEHNVQKYKRAKIEMKSIPSM